MQRRQLLRREDWLHSVSGDKQTAFCFFKTNSLLFSLANSQIPFPHFPPFPPPPKKSDNNNLEVKLQTTTSLTNVVSDSQYKVHVAETLLGFGEQGNKGIFFRGIGEQGLKIRGTWELRQFWGIGNIENQDFVLENKPIFSRGTREQVPPPTHPCSQRYPTAAQCSIGENIRKHYNHLEKQKFAPQSVTTRSFITE